MKSLLADSVAGSVTSTTISQVGDVTNYYVTDGKMGTSLENSVFHDPSKILTQLSSDVALDAAMGGVMGLVGGLPKTNQKIIWSAPTKHNPLGFRLVSPTLQADMRKLRGTLADSTGGAIYQNMGGELRFSNGTKLKIPEAASLKPEEALDWMDKYGANIDQYINKNVSLRAQAKQAAEIQEAILKIGTTAVNDGNAQGYLNTFFRPKTYDDLVKAVQRDGLSGDVMYTEIIQRAKNNTQSASMGCFVGGTLVQTGDGYWKPIKDIQVGDMVMSMPENGIGKPVPKRVINTFQYENKEVWYVGTTRLDGLGLITENYAVTPNHPYMVYGYVNNTTRFFERNDSDATYYDEPRWTRVDQLRMGDILINSSGNYYVVACVKPFYKTKLDKYAWLQRGQIMGGWQGSLEGAMARLDRVNGFGQIFISSDHTLINEIEPLPENEVVATPYYNRDGFTGAMVKGIAYPAYTTTVYNIEVEDYHTYFVGNAQILVHNTNCGKTRLELMLESLGVDLKKASLRLDPTRLSGQKIAVLGKKAFATAIKDLSMAQRKYMVALVDDQMVFDINDPNTKSYMMTQYRGYGAVYNKLPNNKISLYSYSLAYKNPFGGDDTIALGDIMVYKNIGWKAMTNTFGDIKEGALGYHTKAMYG